jgi:hypothetical protein
MRLYALLCCVSTSVVDPHHFDADPYSTNHPDGYSDSEFLFDADSDPTFHPDADADSDPDPNFKKGSLLKSAKIGSYSIHPAYKF